MLRKKALNRKEKKIMSLDDDGGVGAAVNQIESLEM